MDAVAESFAGELVLNYMNPLSAVTAYLLRKGLPALGLCHSVAETAKTLARYLGLLEGELTYLALGVNHLSFFLRLSRGEVDLYPRLRTLAQDPATWELDPVRFEVLRVFGLFPTESSGHLSEYLPYFRKSPALLARYARPGYGGRAGSTPRTTLALCGRPRLRWRLGSEGKGPWSEAGNTPANSWRPTTWGRKKRSTPPWPTGGLCLSSWTSWWRYPCG